MIQTGLTDRFFHVFLKKYLQGSWIMYNIAIRSYDHIKSYQELINRILNRIVVNPDVSGKLVKIDLKIRFMFFM